MSAIWFGASFMRLAVAVCAALLAAVVSGCTPGPSPPDPSPPDQASSSAGPYGELELFTRDILEAGAPSVLIEVRNGNEVWQRAVGVRNLETRDAATISDPVQVASITKSMVAVSVMRLVEDGLLALDDPVSQYLPEFGQVLRPPGPVTIRQLLIHESGVPDFLIPLVRSGPLQHILNTRISLEEQLALAATVPWKRKLAQGFEYSSSNYAALGLVVERLRGRGIGDVLRTDIVEPLGLTHTRMPDARPAPSAMIHGYLIIEDKRVDVTYPAWLIDLASGGAISTVEEVNAFYSALLRGKLLNPASTTDMLGTVGSIYGLGLWRWNDTCTNNFYYGHPGDIDGYGTISMTSADSKRQLTMSIAYPPAPPTLDVNPLVLEMIDLAEHTLNGMC